MGQWKNDFSFTHQLALGNLGWCVSGGQLVTSPLFVFFFLFNTLDVSSFFADPQPHPTLEDIEVSHVRKFNALSEEQRNNMFVATIFISVLRPRDPGLLSLVRSV